jgi:hypothetical protein
MLIENSLVPVFKAKAMIRPESFGAIVFMRGMPAISVNPDGAQILGLVDGIRSVAAIGEIIAAKPEFSENDREKLLLGVRSFISWCFGVGLLCAAEKTMETAQAAV